MSSSSSTSEYTSAHRDEGGEPGNGRTPGYSHPPLSGRHSTADLPFSTPSRWKASSDSASSQGLSSSFPQCMAVAAWKPSPGSSALSESSLFRLAAPLLLLLRLAFSKVSWKENFEPSAPHPLFSSAGHSTCCNAHVSV